MKNLLLAAIAVGSFSLFSFRTASDVKITKNAENPNLYDIESAVDHFTNGYQTYPDNFSAWRQTWTKVIKIQQLEVSMKEMEEVMENL